MAKPSAILSTKKRVVAQAMGNAIAVMQDRSAAHLASLTGAVVNLHNVVQGLGNVWLKISVQMAKRNAMATSNVVAIMVRALVALKLAISAAALGGADLANVAVLHSGEFGAVVWGSSAAAIGIV